MPTDPLLQALQDTLDHITWLRTLLKPPEQEASHEATERVRDECRAVIERHYRETGR